MVGAASKPIYSITEICWALFQCRGLQVTPDTVAFAVRSIVRLGSAARERVREYDLPHALAAWESVVGLNLLSELQS